MFDIIKLISKISFLVCTACKYKSIMACDSILTHIKIYERLYQLIKSYETEGVTMKILTKRIGSNVLNQYCFDESLSFSSVEDVVKTWENALTIKKGNAQSVGLRSAQFGALCAIKSHWTVSDVPATVVMPTGTGKTETMIATIVSESITRTLVIVPSNLLRKQTFDKFISFGILKKIGIIHENTKHPCVALLKSKPKTKEEFDYFIEHSNVIITTMSLLKGFSDEYFNSLNEAIDAVIVDEAHHIAANSWSTVKYKLRGVKCLQFTATPFRNDGKKMDGKIIYNFPLSLAQTQGYFKPIDFKPIWEFDSEQGDLSIAKAAVEQFEKDKAEGYDHLILVRAKDKNSANNLFNNIYNFYFTEYNPVLIHSGMKAKENQKSLEAVKTGKSKIIVCVDMFGEGIDIPNLKIAAMHDKYKSLPITLQFIGRFARTEENLGKATFITNIANDDIAETLKELYSQDADWNTMLNTLSSKEISKELMLQELSDGFDAPLLEGITIQQIRSKVSMTAYHIDEKTWNLDALYKLFDNDKCNFTINNDKGVVVIIEKNEKSAEWTTYKGLFHTSWDLHLIYHNSNTKMLFVNSTVKGVSDQIANALFNSANRVKGENVFKCLYGIKRLMFGTVGLKSAIDGPVRYKMFAGIDVGSGISQAQKETSVKSNLFGVGYHGNGRTSIGCSYKGIIWSRWVESIDFWMNWCNEIAEKINDPSINTDEIFAGALIPEFVQQRPNSIPYAIEWPLDIELLNDDSIVVFHNGFKYNIYELEIKLTSNLANGPIEFSVGNELFSVDYKMEFVDNKAIISPSNKQDLLIQKGRYECKLSDFMNTEYPIVKFIDQSLLEGNILIRIPTGRPTFAQNNIIVWNWENTNIRKESQGREKERDSIQYRVIDTMKKEKKYDIIFNDDGPGEIADVVCMSMDNDEIFLDLYHCKYSHGDHPGARMSDLYEVCGQAEKSVKWCQDYKGIIERMCKREARCSSILGSRIEVGDTKTLMKYKNMIRFYKVKLNIYIVQPGVDSKSINDDMSALLNGTAANLMDTYSIPLKLICS